MFARCKVCKSENIAVDVMCLLYSNFHRASCVDLQRFALKPKPRKSFESVARQRFQNFFLWFV